MFSIYLYMFLLSHPVYISTMSISIINKKIDFVWGNEWEAGNLSYHLKSRPKWMGPLGDYVSLDKKMCITTQLCVGHK